MSSFFASGSLFMSRGGVPNASLSTISHHSHLADRRHSQGFYDEDNIGDLPSARVCLSFGIS